MTRAADGRRAAEARRRDGMRTGDAAVRDVASSRRGGGARAADRRMVHGDRYADPRSQTGGETEGGRRGGIGSRARACLGGEGGRGGGGGGIRARAGLGRRLAQGPRRATSSRRRPARAGPGPVGM